MDEKRNFEIAWRELLIKRLKTVQGVLRRDAAAEKKALTDESIAAAGYSSVEDAHEAYGWGEITEKQFNLIKLRLENPGKSPSAAAVNKLSFTIGLLQGELNDLRTNSKLAAEYIGEEE